MRSTIRLGAGAGFTVEDLRIVERSPAWTQPETGRNHRMVFVRRGVFRLRRPGWEGLADPVTAYVGLPGDEQSIGHKPGREDVCTVVTLNPEFASELLPDRPPATPIPTTGRIDLAQRVLAARARSGADAFELTERVVWLGLALAKQQRHDRVSTAARRRLAEQARELLGVDPVRLGLDQVARTLHVSRSHLSRVFHAETGETLTRFRNRLRVRGALDRIEAGETDLSRLAAELGFADHSHLSRTMRAETGRSPSQARGLLRN
jgi:AraC-like DNA-binding protein